MLKHQKKDKDPIKQKAINPKHRDGPKEGKIYVKSMSVACPLPYPCYIWASLLKLVIKEFYMSDMADIKESLENIYVT